MASQLHDAVSNYRVNHGRHELGWIFGNSSRSWLIIFSTCFELFFPWAKDLSKRLTTLSKKTLEISQNSSFENYSNQSKKNGIKDIVFIIHKNWIFLSNRRRLMYKRELFISYASTTLPCPKYSTFTQGSRRKSVLGCDVDSQFTARTSNLHVSHRDNFQCYSKVPLQQKIT